MMLILTSVFLVGQATTLHLYSVSLVGQAFGFTQGVLRVSQCSSWWIKNLRNP
jgi:hypothetical protein